MYTDVANMCKQLSGEIRNWLYSRNSDPIQWDHPWIKKTSAPRLGLASKMALASWNKAENHWVRESDEGVFTRKSLQNGGGIQKKHYIQWLQKRNIPPAAEDRTHATGPWRHHWIETGSTLHSHDSPRHSQIFDLVPNASSYFQLPIEWGDGTKHPHRSRSLLTGFLSFSTVEKCKYVFSELGYIIQNTYV